MSYNITPILEALIGLCVVVITSIFIPYLKTKLTAEQEKTILALVKIAVSAAEQIYKEHGSGKKKKEYVLKWLADRGIKVDTEKLDALIESEVYKITSGKDDGNE